MRINEIRRDCLRDAANLLARTSPKEQTFHDTYNHAVSKLLEIADELDKSIHEADKRRLQDA